LAKRGGGRFFNVYVNSILRPLISVIEKSYSVDFEKNKQGIFFTPILINGILKT
jgi:hypothetical protein